MKVSETECIPVELSVVVPTYNEERHSPSVTTAALVFALSVETLRLDWL
jgi:hypothetical protein